MKVSKLQAIFSSLVVGEFVLIILIVILMPVSKEFPPDEYKNHLRTFISIYSGIVAVISGFFLGKIWALQAGKLSDGDKTMSLNLQAVFGFIIIGFCLIVTAVATLMPVLGGFPPDEYIEHLRTFAFFYSSVIGITVGFFLGNYSEIDKTIDMNR